MTLSPVRRCFDPTRPPSGLKAEALGPVYSRWVCASVCCSFRTCLTSIVSLSGPATDPLVEIFLPSKPRPPPPPVQTPGLRRIKCPLGVVVGGEFLTRPLTRKVSLSATGQKGRSFSPRYVCGRLDGSG